MKKSSDKKIMLYDCIYSIFQTKKISKPLLSSLAYLYESKKNNIVFATKHNKKWYEGKFIDADSIVTIKYDTLIMYIEDYKHCKRVKGTFYEWEGKKTPKSHEFEDP